MTQKMISIFAVLLSGMTCGLACAACRPPLQAQVIFNYASPPYSTLPEVARDTGLDHAATSMRAKAMQQALETYRARHGAASAPPGTVVLAMYQGGATEEGQVRSGATGSRVELLSGSLLTAQQVDYCSKQPLRPAESPATMTARIKQQLSNRRIGKNSITWSCYNYYSDNDYTGTDCPHSP